MIAEDYVSFKVAKLLKEKGFDGICGTAYETITNEHEVEQCSISEWGKLGQVKRPTLQMAMKWLREEHNIIICTHAYYPVDPYELSYRNNKPYWKIRIMNPVYSRDYDSFNTYEQACESGIRYCLENLI